MSRDLPAVSHRAEGFTASALAFLAVSLLLAACSAVPSSDELTQVIRQHFEARGYRVVDLVTGDVEPLETGEKRYMGTEGYTVRVRRIVIETSDRAGPAVEAKGKGQMVFTDAAVSVREKPGERGVWLVTNIQGIAVP